METINIIPGTGTIEIRHKHRLLHLITLGIVGLCRSRKGTLALLLLTIMTVLCSLGKIDGIAFSACASVVSGIFAITQSSTDRAAINSATTPTPYPPT